MASKEEQIADLKKKIKVMESNDEPILATKYKAELAKIVGESASSDSGEDFVIPGVTEEDYQASGSKFAAAGAHMSEFGMPYWKSPGVSLAFPFTIVEGPDKGKESEISAGISLKAVWKLKEILTALGVKTGKDKAGNLKFDPNEVAGKRGQTIWTTQVDTRPVEEGGKGGKYQKPTSVIAEDAAPPADIT